MLRKNSVIGVMIMRKRSFLIVHQCGIGDEAKRFPVLVCEGGNFLSLGKGSSVFVFKLAYCVESRRDDSRRRLSRFREDS